MAKDSPDSMPMITGYVIDGMIEEIAVAARAALMPRTSYALISQARDLPMGAAFGGVLERLARFVKIHIDWKRHTELTTGDFGRVEIKLAKGGGSVV